MALPEGEHDEAVVARAERVRVLEREVDEAVARADGVRLLVVAVGLERDARAGEDVEDLLLGALEMQRRRPASGIDRIRFTPTVIELSPVSDCQDAAMWPARAEASTSSQCVITR